MNVVAKCLVSMIVFASCHEPLPKSKPELTFQPPASGVYENDKRICISCYGVNLRCDDELTREDLLSILRFCIAGTPVTICEDEKGVK